MDEQSELFRLFKIGQADLDANRLGRLGDSELRRIRRRRIVGVISGAVITALCVAAAFNDVHAPAGWIGAGVLALLAGLATVAYAVFSMRSALAVTCTTGAVAIDVTSAGRGGTIVKLNVAGTAFNLPRPPGGMLAEIPEAFGKVLTQQPYHVYAYRSTVVAMEPTAEGAPLSIGQSADAQPTPIRGYHPMKMNAFGIGVLVVGMVIAVGLWVAGGLLMAVQFTGTPATATVESCNQDPDATTADSYICIGTWNFADVAPSSASPFGGLGGFGIGTIQGASPDDVGKTVAVRVSGGEAYEEGLALPLLIIGGGLVMAFLTVAALIRARRRG